MTDDPTAAEPGGEARAEPTDPGVADPGEHQDPIDLAGQLPRYGQVMREASATDTTTEVVLAGSSRGRDRRPWLVAAAVVLVLAVAGLAVAALHPAGTRVESGTTSATAAPAPASTIDPHETQAQATAEDLARRMQVDPAWTVVATLPVAVMSQPPSIPGTPNLATITERWTSPSSWSDTDAWIAAHPPSGLGQSGSGSLADRSGTTLRTTTFAPRHGTDFDFGQEVLVSTAPLPGGGTAVRMDVQVTWVPTRPPAAVVAAGMSAVSVSVTWDGTSGPRPPAAPTFTDHATIESLRRTVNGLSMPLPGVHSCPADVGLRYTLRFTGPGQPAALVVSGTCGDTSLTLGRSPAVGLSTGGTLLDQEARLLGTTTSALNDQARRASTVPAVTPTTAH